MVDPERSAARLELRDGDVVAHALERHLERHPDDEPVVRERLSARPRPPAWAATRAPNAPEAFGAPATRDTAGAAVLDPERSAAWLELRDGDVVAHPLERHLERHPDDEPVVRA